MAPALLLLLLLAAPSMGTLAAQHIGLHGPRTREEPSAAPSKRAVTVTATTDAPMVKAVSTHPPEAAPQVFPMQPHRLLPAYLPEDWELPAPLDVSGSDAAHAVAAADCGVCRAAIDALVDDTLQTSDQGDVFESHPGGRHLLRAEIVGGLLSAACRASTLQGLGLRRTDDNMFELVVDTPAGADWERNAIHLSCHQIVWQHREPLAALLAWLPAKVKGRAERIAAYRDMISNTVCQASCSFS
eukprot:TRINITY_DN16055_c0_g1_i1.p1 TRINITY_DN16055_c0_g1~~TRINITY_DN16055_c0_g1_i1.p1  ORF type:complete len:243 (-),score=26.33 TRINITY_DN16055_c0_g1_i1:134-862(-)